MSHDCCVALPSCAVGLSAVCDCGIPDHTHLLFWGHSLVRAKAAIRILQIMNKNSKKYSITRLCHLINQIGIDTTVCVDE